MLAKLNVVIQFDCVRGRVFASALFGATEWKRHSGVMTEKVENIYGIADLAVLLHLQCALGHVTQMQWPFIYTLMSQN